MKKTIVLFMMMLAIPFSLGLELEILNTEPAPIVAGEYADITIKLTDQVSKQTYQDLSIAIEENNDMRAIGSAQEHVGRFVFTESITRTFRVLFGKDLPSGKVKVTFIVNSDLGIHRFEKEVSLSDAKTQPDIRIGKIKSVPDELLEDTDDNQVIVTLQNLGETKAELVTADLSYNSKLIKPSSSFSMQDSLASIDAGSQQDLEFTFDILENVKDDIPATLNLRYRSRQSVSDTYTIYEKPLRIVFPLAESPLLKVVDVKSPTLKTGSTDNKILVTIKNEGSKEADDVRIRMHPDISYPFIFDATTHYIASELKPGEESEIQFEIEVTKRGTTREYPISVELESLVGQTLYSREDSIKLSVVEVKSISNRAVGIGIIGLVILVAIGFSIYHRMEKKRKK